MELVIAHLESRVKELTTKLKSAEQARCNALADREWWTHARQHLNQEMQVGLLVDGVIVWYVV